MATDTGAVFEYRQQARTFLARAQDYLANGDLHQASEKGWGSAAHMAKALAEAQGRSYRTHDEFRKLIVDCARESGVDRLRQLGHVANGLHSNYYQRALFLDADAIRRDLDEIKELLDTLEGQIEAALA